MKKLKLDLDDLAVESFATTPEARDEGGTVFGQQCTCYTQCTCPGCPTCDASCNGTCGATCEASCNGTCDGATCGGTCDGAKTCYYGCGYDRYASYYNYGNGCYTGYDPYNPYNNCQG